jgi:hypothetical protein
LSLTTPRENVLAPSDLVVINNTEGELLMTTKSDGANTFSLGVVNDN